MDLLSFTLAPQRLPGPTPVSHTPLPETELRPLAEQVHTQGGRLISLWGQVETLTNQLHLLWALDDGLLWTSVTLTSEDYAALDDLFPHAARMQRATYDVVGLRARGARDQRPWWRHESWPADYFPLRNDSASPAPSAPQTPYPFITVSGPGVHEIPVGPVHAGVIEPGHFRFSVVGERILRLDTHLGYTHKGVEQRALSLDPMGLVRLGGRLSGDSTVAGAWAAAQALEGLLGLAPPPRAEWLRALWLERERVINHLGDLGYLCNDVGLASGFSLFWAVKERALRTHARWAHQRYLRDQVVLGGVAQDMPVEGLDELLSQGLTLEREVRRLEALLQEHAGVQDRLLTTGRVAPDMAARWGLVGLAGRASAQAWDGRITWPTPPYAHADVRMVTRNQGDVAARMAVRFEEIYESLRLIRHFIVHLPAGDWVTPWDGQPRAGLGLGYIEGWRGEVIVAMEMKEDGTIRRWHPEEASMSNWPMLEIAVLGNIVADFPLINKSFNLSYSGQDG